MLARFDCAQILAAVLPVWSFTGAAEQDYDTYDPVRPRRTVPACGGRATEPAPAAPLGFR